MHTYVNLYVSIYILRFSSSRFTHRAIAVSDSKDFRVAFSLRKNEKFGKNCHSIDKCLHDALIFKYW